MEETNQYLAKITMNEKGEFFVENLEGDTTKSGPLKFCDENDKTIVLTKNDSNRWWANRAKVTAACEKDGAYPLVYKESKHFGTPTAKTPNQKLIEYLSEEEKKEYLEIIERAKKAMEEAKAKPVSELDKAKIAAAKAAKKYEQLLAQAAGVSANTVEATPIEG